MPFGPGTHSHVVGSGVGVVEKFIVQLCAVAASCEKGMVRAKTISPGSTNRLCQYSSVVVPGRLVPVKLLLHQNRTSPLGFGLDGGLKIW